MSRLMAVASLMMLITPRLIGFGQPSLPARHARLVDVARNAPAAEVPAGQQAPITPDEFTVRRHADGLQQLAPDAVGEPDEVAQVVPDAVADPDVGDGDL